MTTVEIFNNTWTARPSVLAAARGDVLLACSVLATQAPALGLPAVGAVVRISPTFGSGGASGATSKINYIGKAASLMAAGQARVSGNHQVNFQLDKARGVRVTDARGIPPRGRPV